MTAIKGRRKTMFGSQGMRMLDIQSRPGRPFRRDIYSNQGEDVLGWIEQHTTGDFYLSDFSIGFADQHDLFMFMIAFKR